MGGMGGTPPTATVREARGGGGAKGLLQCFATCAVY